MNKLVLTALVAVAIAGCGPSRDKVLSSFQATSVVGRPDTVVIRRSPVGTGSPRATEAAMLLTASRALSASGFDRFVIVKTGVVTSKPKVWGYILRGFERPYEAPEAVYSSYDSEVMVVRGLRVYEPSYRGAVDIGVITRQLADDPLYP